jgi:hypothetical protein
MNLLALEKKFQELDARDKEISNFYNPISKGGRKHLYVNDLKGDFHYNNIIYGMDIFVDQDTTPKFFKPDPPTPPPVKIKSPTKARRLQPAVHALRSSPEKDCYLGIYSTTRIKKPELLIGAIKNSAVYKAEPDRRDNHDFWKTSGILKSDVENSAAVSRLKVSKSNGPEHIDRNLKYAKNISHMNKGRKTAPENTFRQFIQEMSEKSQEFNHFASVTGLKQEDNSDSRYLYDADLELLNGLQESESDAEIDAEVTSSNDLKEVRNSETSSESPKTTEQSEPAEAQPIENSQSICTILEDREKDFSPYLKSYEFQESDSYMLQIRVLKYNLSYSYSYYSIIFTDISLDNYPQEVVSNVKCLKNGYLQVGSSKVINPYTLFSWMSSTDSLSGHTVRIQVIGHAHLPHNIIDRYIHFDRRSSESEETVRDELGKYEEYIASQRNVRKDRKIVPQQPHQETTNEPENRSLSPFRFISARLQDIKKKKESPDYNTQEAKSDRNTKNPEIRTMKKTTPQVINKLIRRDKTWSSASKPIKAMGGGFRTGYSVFQSGQPKPANWSEDAKEAVLIMPVRGHSKQLNPMTTALYRYRNDKSAYHPDAYPANLSQYQLDDLIEDKYRSNSKVKIKKKVVDHQEEIDVKGYSVRQLR